MRGLSLALAAIALALLFHRAMIADQRALCARSDAIACPRSIWIWESF